MPVSSGLVIHKQKVPGEEVIFENFYIGGKIFSNYFLIGLLYHIPVSVSQLDAVE